MPYKNIVFDKKTGWNLGTGTSFSQSYTMGTGGEAIIIFILCTRNAQTTGGVTYGGVSMTRAKQNYYDSFDTEIWYLVNPKTGTNSIVTNLTSGNDRAIAGAVSFFNVDQLSPVNGTFERDVVSDNAWTTGCNATIPNCVGVDAVFHGSSALGSPVAGQTLIKSRNNEDFGGCSYETDIDTSSESMGWGGLNSDDGAHAIVVFGPAPSTGAFLLNLL